MRYISLPLIGLFCVLASAANAADIAGQALQARKGPAREAVVFLEGPRQAAPMPAMTVDQRDKMFLPHVTVITRGTTVNFPNHDTVLHNVFAYYNAKKFDLGVYPRGATKRVTFDKTGVVALLCNVHSDMSAYILVVDTPYYAVTDALGRFAIRGVPPGAYTLHAWHESGDETIRRVTVAAGNTPLSLVLTRK